MVLIYDCNKKNLYDLGNENRVKPRETLENKPKMFFFCIKFNKKLLCGLNDTVPQAPQPGCSRALIGMDFSCTLKS